MYEIQKVPHWSSVVKTRSNGFGTRRAASPVSRTKKISYQDIVKSTHSMASGDDNKDPSLNWTLLQCGIFRNSRRHKGHPLFFKISDGG
jgi:hypothetical protein